MYDYSNIAELMNEPEGTVVAMGREPNTSGEIPFSLKEFKVGENFDNIGFFRALAKFGYKWKYRKNSSMWVFENAVGKRLIEISKDFTVGNGIDFNIVIHLNRRKFTGSYTNVARKWFVKGRERPLHFNKANPVKRFAENALVTNFVQTSA